MDSKTFTVTVESPHGKQAIEQFAHFLSKVSSEAKERWDIRISIEEQTDGEASMEEFS